MFTVKYKASVGLCVEKKFLFRISEPRACDAYYCPLLSNFLKISRSSNDEKRKGGQEEGDVVEVDEMVEVDEKR